MFPLPTLVYVCTSDNSIQNLSILSCLNDFNISYCPLTINSSES